MQGLGPLRDNESQKNILVSGAAEMVVSMQYPLIVYNSYKPDNTELIIANMADKNKKLYALNLNKCHFLAFVTTNYSVENEKR